MKRTLFLAASTVLFFGTAGLTNLSASTNHSMSHSQAVEVTGCLQAGPVAKEYLLQASDGTTWGINETDMLLNNYIGHSVTVAGDRMHATTAERRDGGASHYLLARDVVVENQPCQK
jgi:hypothetical protein